MTIHNQYKNLAALAALVTILVLSSMGIARYNKNEEDNKGMMTFSVIGMIFSLFSILSLGLYIKSGGSQDIIPTSDV